MNRLYKVAVGPTLIQRADGGFEEVVSPVEHDIYGTAIRYHAVGDTIFVQILDTKNNVVFSASAYTILWVKLGIQLPDGPCEVVKLTSVK